MQSQPSETQQLFFHSPSFGDLTLDGVFAQIAAFRAVAPEREYRLLIGTDSLPGQNGTAVLVTAVVLHRVHNGGIFFLTRRRSSHCVTLQQRMYEETLASIEIARRFVEAASPDNSLLFGNLEIHVDIGHRGPTRELIREIVGMVTAYGFPVRTKPESIAATTVADRFTVPA